MKKVRMVSFISALFVFAASFSVVAAPAPASPSDAVMASPSDADMVIDDPVDGMDTISLLPSAQVPRSSIGTVVDTVDRSKTFIEVNYQDVSGGQAQTKIFPVDNSGAFSIDVGAGNKILFIAIWFPKEALPLPGTYAFSFDLSSAVGMSYSSVDFYSQRLQNNAAGLWSANSISFQQNSGDLYIAPTVIDLGSVNDCRLGIRFGVNEHLFGGSFRARFESSSASPDITTAGAGSEYSQQDFQNSVSGGLSSIQDTLLEIVQTISLQLEALWQQIYSGIHQPTYARLGDILNAIKDLNVDITVDNSELISEIQQQTNNQINNDNKNTDEITNGYDSSGMNSTNQQLDSALSGLESSETEVVDSVKDRISDFEYDSFFDKFTKPMQDISYFLTGIYTGLAALNIPIGFSLTLTIALICIGYYRFKGGG